MDRPIRASLQKVAPLLFMKARTGFCFTLMRNRITADSYRRCETSVYGDAEAVELRARNIWIQFMKKSAATTRRKTKTASTRPTPQRSQPPIESIDRTNLAMISGSLVPILLIFVPILPLLMGARSEAVAMWDACVHMLPWVCTACYGGPALSRIAKKFKRLHKI